ncbi:uncharacterized protein N7484_001849 [Penicillium longicatenatum]|uniref:uncharacterized protein n=1 Tax=Penicillium longicatenatum TaxID=1561947 RepID=UPI0025474168|nr:uncharacterized protein N7484_001849 [Penicillium longicatenatum]KAJ5658200.1 hypothetical protein N7484_001849 [Penicillium longicatenatum]
MNPIVHPIFEPKTSSWQYIVVCPKTKECAIIDPVLDYDLGNFVVSTQSADALLKIVRKHHLTVTHLLETHAHTDHLSAAYYIQATLWTKGHPNAPICIGENITIVQNLFAHKYNIPKEELKNSFDHLFSPNETFRIGEMTAVAMHLPGHSPDHGGYHVGPDVFTGDTVFMPDVGSARCDFPGGDLGALWKSMQRLLAFPDTTRLYTGHDFPPNNEAYAPDPKPYVTVAEQKETNKHMKNGSTEEDFMAWSNQRDQVLSEPNILHQALQVNCSWGKDARPFS